MEEKNLNGEPIETTQPEVIGTTGSEVIVEAENTVDEPVLTNADDTFTEVIPEAPYEPVAPVEAPKKKLNKKTLIGAVAAVVAVVLVALIIKVAMPKPADYMAKGNYEKAYSVASKSVKDDVKFENLAAYCCGTLIETLKNPDSFKLRDAWFDRENGRIILEVGGTNSYGGTVSNYWYFCYLESKGETYNYITCISDLDKDEYSKYDDEDDLLEKLIDNSVRDIITDMIYDKDIKLSKESVKNINTLFDSDMLEDVELLDIDWSEGMTEKADSDNEEA